MKLYHVVFTFPKAGQALFNAAVVSTSAEKLTPRVVKGMQYDLAKKAGVNSYQVVIVSITALEGDELNNLVAEAEEETASTATMLQEAMSIDLDFILLFGALAYEPLNVRQAVATAKEIGLNPPLTEGLAVLRFFQLAERGLLEKVGDTRLPETVRLTEQGREVLLAVSLKLHRLSAIVITQLKEFSYEPE